MATATQTSKILSAEQEAKLRQPIDEYVGKSRRRSMNFVLTVLKKLSISRMSWIT